MDKFREFLATVTGKVITVVLCLAFLGLAGMKVYSFFQGDTPASANQTMYICTETGKSFKHTNKMGEVQPIYSPHSGKNTGVPAEPCFWTADGKPKTEPTWVLLNGLAGKPEPTFCPDCGRLVVGHNPQPGPSGRVPPNKAEYESRRREFER